MAKALALFLAAACLFAPCIADAEDAVDTTGAQWSSLYDDSFGASASVAGNVSEAGRFGIIVRGTECTVTWPFFLVSTSRQDINPETLSNSDLTLRLNWAIRDARITAIRKEDSGYNAIVSLGRMHFGRFQTLYGNGERISAYILEAAGKENDVFDQPWNVWNTDNLAQALEEARSLCLQHARTDPDPESCDEVATEETLEKALTAKLLPGYVAQAEKCLAIDLSHVERFRRNALLLSANVEDFARKYGTEREEIIRGFQTLLRLTAEAGDPAAQFFQAWQYNPAPENPMEVTRVADESSSEFWMRNAAAQQYAGALFTMAMAVIKHREPPSRPELERAYTALFQAARLEKSPGARKGFQQKAAEILPRMHRFIGKERAAELEAGANDFDYASYKPVLTRELLEE